jgi:hypothetical protein
MAVMAQALRDAYADLFLIKAHPSKSDRVAIEGKFKSFHNTSDNVAGLMAKTFFALLSLADLSATADGRPPASIVPEPEKPGSIPEQEPILDRTKIFSASGLHYNIQIHLPATKDTEVYNAIFKSIKEHLFDE